MTVRPVNASLAWTSQNESSQLDTAEEAASCAIDLLSQAERNNLNSTDVIGCTNEAVRWRHRLKFGRVEVKGSMWRRSQRHCKPWCFRGGGG